MTILVVHDRQTLKVEPGFVRRLAFGFGAKHEEGDRVAYDPTGSYEIEVHYYNPNGDKRFVGYGLIKDVGELSKPITNPRGGSTPRWLVMVPLQAQTIAEIDSVRRTRGDDRVRFMFEWHMLARRSEGGSPSAPMNIVVAQEEVGGSSTPKVEVTLQDWARVLEDYGLPSRRWVELVFPMVDKQQWLKAAQHLEQADRDFDSRRDKQCLDFCEQALEEVLGRNVVMQSDELQARSDIDGLLQSWGLADPRKRELAVRLVHSVTLYARRGKHQALAAGHPAFDPNSSEAELGLLTTKAVLGFLSTLRS